MAVPFVYTRIDLPSGENFNPVQSATFSFSVDETVESIRKLLNGPLSYERRSYNLMHSEFMPVAKIRPSGSNAATWFRCEERRGGKAERKERGVE